MAVTVQLPDDLVKEVAPYLGEAEDLETALSDLVQEALRTHLALWPSPAAALLELAGIVSQVGVQADEGAEDRPEPTQDRPSQLPRYGHLSGH